MTDTPEPTRREDFFDEFSARIDELLDDDGGGTVGGSAAQADPFVAPEQIGPYKILQELGDGGMGVVYIAEQREPVKRRVALKLIKPGMDSREVLTRFEAERQALALMNHRNVARVIDAGVTERGLPYFVMEYVKGAPIIEFCDQERLSTEQRLELFLEVCAGVQHAHQKGLLHRDLKPANILVTLEDGKAAAKIIDFGVAKALHQPLTDHSLYTQVGAIIGTPEYMSPEQASPSGSDIDTRSDVYALGVVLYELLSGELPFALGRLAGVDFGEMLRLIREEIPQRPSTRVSTLGDRSKTGARNRRADPKSWIKSVRGDLDWVVMKALEKERDRRYQSVDAFADDVRRFLRNEPVDAGPPSGLYRIKKYVSRHKIAVGAASVALVSLIVGLGMALVAWADARESEAAAKRSATAAQESESAAIESRDAARLAKANYDRLAGLVRVDQLRARDTWPARAEFVSAMELWVQDAEETLGRLEEHREFVKGFETTNARRDLDGKLVFASAADEFLHRSTRDLIDELEELDGEFGEIASMRGRIDVAKTIRERSVVKHRDLWEAAAERVRANPAYERLALAPQVGLVPLGPDPRSGLEEFAELTSGDVAWRSDAASSIVLGDASGIVLVLIPGGSCTVGAQSRDPGGPNYDALARRNERIGNADLDAFFLSKFELTQTQWLRLSRLPDEQNPSRFSFHDKKFVTRRDPVEMVSWDACDRLARQSALRLPTEHEWEWACRTSRVWWRLDAPEEIARWANVADASAERAGLTAQSYESFSDGFPGHAPVGELAPNTFGLHDMLGNVWEWCSGNYARRDPRRPLRGGSFSNIARDSRCASRKGHLSTAAYQNLGVRFARSIE